MTVAPVQNLSISFPNKPEESQTSKITLLAIGILATIGFLAAGMYLAAALLSICIIGLKFIPQKDVLSHTDPISQQIEQFHNPRISDKIVGVYISSNETNLDASTQLLKSMPPVSRSCHIGFSGWHNFDIMSVRKSDYGLICDFNPHNKKFIEKTLATLKEVNSREEFAEKMSEAMDGIVICPKENRNLSTASLEIHGELEREGSWLSTEEGFLHIKFLAEMDRIIAIAEDICNTEVFEKISEIYKSENIEVDTLYLSNISLFMKGQTKKAAFLKTIHALIEDKTCIIHCPLKERFENGVRVERKILDQDAVLGKDLLDDTQLFNCR